MRSKKSKILRIIIISAAALLTSAGALVVFMKRRAIMRRFFIYILTAVIFCAVSTAAYAVEQETEPDDDITETETEPEPDIIIEITEGEAIEIDITDYITEPTREQTPLTPPGNMTLVDDITGEHSEDKQFITVTTKSGNYFYIIIDRAGDRENVHFLNQIDERDLLTLLEDEKAAPPATTATPTASPPAQTEPSEDTHETQPRKTNTTGLLIMLAVIAAVGGGAYYLFKARKPKQSGKKGAAAISELDNFDFEPDEDDLFGGNTNEPESENTTEEDIPDFTAKNESEGEE